MNIQHSRSFLFVPGDRPQRYAKAVASGADAVIIDLEDAVAPAAKESARAACRDYLAGGGRACIRINSLETQWGQSDLALCMLEGVAGIVLPKAETAQQLARLREHTRPGVALLPLIETAAGLAAAGTICAAPGVQRLMFGSVDFCLDLGLDEDRDVLAPYRAMLVLAARSARLPGPVDGVTLAIDDQAALRLATGQARQAGFSGKLCIHPSQVAGVNAGFLPSAAQLDWANAVLTRAACSEGAFAFEGKMVDAPVLARARQLLEQHNCWP